MTKINKSNIIFNILLFISFNFNCALAQQGTWTQKANFGGSARSSCISFSIGSKGYIGSGRSATNQNEIDFWEYDPQNDTWSQKADMSNTGRSFGLGFSIGNKGYAGLGIIYSDPKSDFWEYDPQNNTWTQKAFYPGTGKLSCVGFSIDNFGYIGTGSPSGPIGYETKEFWQYNPANDSWTRKADFAGKPRDRAVGFSIFSKGYIGTGYSSTGSFNDFWEYNPVNDSWTEKTSFPVLNRNNAVGFSTSSRGYIGMGYINQTDFWQYNPTNDSWLQVAGFRGEGRVFGTGFSIGNNGYVGMGYTVGTKGTILYKDIWKYEEDVTLGLNQQYFQNKFEVYPNPASNFINLSNNDVNIIETILYNTEGKQQLKTPFNLIAFGKL
jgi:hypothetical protein